MLIDTIEHLRSLSNENYFLQQFSYLILQKNIHQRTPIHEAAKTGNFVLLEFFFRLITPENENQKRALCQDSDDELKTSLHLAAAQGHAKIVRLLLKHGANVSSCDMNDSTPLHEAAAHNRYQCVQILLQYQAPIDRFDGKHYTPLHRASQYGHWQIVRLLLNFNADIRRTNCDGYNSLEVAILNNHQSTVREFFKHQTWKHSLRNAQIQPMLERKKSRKYEDLSTPLRKLIRYMPNEAEEVFTKCMREFGGSEDYAYKIIFNYEFLEDQLSIFKWKQGEKAKIDPRGSCQSPSPQPMDSSSVINTHVYSLRQNHPLYMIITYHQHDLLKHPLIDRLIKRKWRQFSRTFFWILFLFYGTSFVFSSFDHFSSLLGFFLASFTFTVLRVHHPQYYYSLFNASISTASCQTISLNLLRHESFILTKKNSFDTIIKWLLFSTILIHIIKNLLLICIRLKMFFGLSNILELIALILSIIFSHDFYSWQMSIRFRCSFQWQCGAFGILIAWITLIIYVQFLSPSGIYVVMLEVILRKFLRFIPILIIFILGFGLAFHMLLQNQNVYSHTFDALIRTVVMLTGEFNYEEHIYHSENDSDRSYYQIIYFVYILFCILMTILIMNLLIASAVGEIPPLLDRAQVKYSIICIKLIMNYEIFLSTFDWLIPSLKERVKMLIETNQNELIYPNRSKQNYHQLKKFFNDRRKQLVEKLKEERMDELFSNLSSK